MRFTIAYTQGFYACPLRKTMKTQYDNARGLKKMNNIWQRYSLILGLAGCLAISHTAQADVIQDFLRQQTGQALHAGEDGLQKLLRTKAAAADLTANAARLSRNEADQLIASAMGLIGVAYRFSGTSPTSGMDCSGFMQYIFRKTLQVNLPRTAAEQARMGSQVNRSNLQPGDMVFFNTAGSRISHVGMYIGNNRFIHAPRTGKSIEITSMSNKYWNSKYVTARRVKPRNADQFTN